MDVARLNFSHGNWDEHGRRAETIRAESEKLGKPVAILQDLCGPKIRTAAVGPKSVDTGATVYLISGSAGDDSTIAIEYDGLTDDVRPGDRVILGDGNVELSVAAIEGDRVRARVEHGGGVRSRMGVNLPSKRVRLRALTEKDKEDLNYGLSIGVDYVAMSFVRNADDIEELRALCEQKGRPTPIIAKIETPSAVEHLDSIIKAADGAMVARGDLGVELPPEHVPVIQKQIIVTCRRYKRPVIVATEMLQSMVDAPRPTRAEASDVAHAVFGGTDAVMLSAESATGKYPLLACKMMERIIVTAEGSSFWQPIPAEPGDTVQEAAARAACDVAREVGAKVIVALTETGGTARLVAKARPHVPIIAFSPDAQTLRRLALHWGVAPHAVAMDSDIEMCVKSTNEFLVKAGICVSSDRYVIVYGAPMGVRGTTNAVRVERVP